MGGRTRTSFQKGRKKVGGRKKGSLNTWTKLKSYLEMLDAVTEAKSRRIQEAMAKKLSRADHEALLAWGLRSRPLVARRIEQPGWPKSASGGATPAPAP